jgi:hypothetical protein
MARINQPVFTPALHVPGIAKDASSLLISTYLCVSIALLLVLLSTEQFVHWFIIPVTVCGIIIGVDAVDWLRGRMDLMDPVGWVGLFGVHFFFIAPLLIILWDYQMLYLPVLEDWRPWLGGMGILNAAGLVIYRLSRGWVRLHPAKPRQKIRVIDRKFMLIVLYFALGVTFTLQVLVYVQAGGLEGYINQFETGGFTGSGALFAFSESFPFLLLIGIVAYARSDKKPRTWLFILLVLLIFFVIRLLFGGLRGSRSNTIYAMIWALGVIHLWLRPVPRRFLALGMVAGLLFLYIMGFYKALGSDFGRVLENPTQLSALEQETRRTFQGALVGDLSRADVQAYMLRNLSRWPDFPYAWGRTYVGGYLAVIPSVIYSNKPVSKVMEGTQALLGVGTYSPGVVASSRVYGLMGEAMLNFGIVAAPLSFISLGLLVGYVRRWYYNLHHESVFRLWIPFLIILCVTYGVSDSDNNAVSLVMRAMVPGIVLWLGSKPVEVGPETV